VQYSMRVTREYEEEYWETDSEGRRVRRTRRGSETVASNSRSVPFFVRDSSGKIRVIPEGASFVAEKSVSRFEPGETHGDQLRIGSLNIAIGALGSGRRTIGYRYEEDLVPVGKDIYVLGEANDRGGALAVSKPERKDAKFIISLKSEEQLVRGAKGAVTGLGIGAIAALAVGAVLVVLNFFIR
jgi:hypothetical protein